MYLFVVQYQQGLDWGEILSLQNLIVNPDLFPVTVVDICLNIDV